MAKDKQGNFVPGPRFKAKKAKEAEIMKKIDKYVKSRENKDENGVVIDNPILVVTPENLLEFYRSGVLSGLNKEDAHFAKHYFKSLLPFKEYRESRGKDREKRIDDIIHFQELMEGGEF